MNLSHIRILVAVVETGSFTKAAEMLDITQSGVSHAISSLESELEIPLLVRERNGITLTESGERILGHCREILYRVNRISEEAQKFSNMEKGKIRIGSFPSAASRLFPKILASFHRKHPNVEIVLFEGTDEEVLEWLHSLSIDIAFTTSQEDGFEVIPVSRDQYYAVLPPEHHLFESNFLDVSNVKNEPFIMPKGGCQPLIIETFAKIGISPNIKYQVRDMGTVLSMVQEGLGWTIVPEKVLPNELTGVSPIPLYPSVWRNIGLAVLSLKESPDIVKSFIEEAKKVFQVK
ncbi:LysR family transcriptional regulator [Bacillus sp. ISL-40]|uniref:LysR family transcriptional regulator n=1 Tax=unclassified Bacillus (in: firmicutes) TaxID=185979 RepID=UPI001BE5FFCF|nr:MULTISPECIES: LysR family transcriptional regulator [unclassified Bacillus (in: firmicutes)]MBT2700351.1 LysR family transcriptional regulator [Bacillus sp. ISL-40]MBT2742384.1 LysR family transcriptional regulator [Bacillus sp. ISL-77]